MPQSGKKALTSLTGHLLIAMPQMPDPRFEKTVIYICAHSAEGAMGLVVNRLFDGITFTSLLHQLDIDITSPARELRVHFGGPVESGRGFVLHSGDYNREGSMPVDDGVVLTATVDILRAVAEGQGPERAILALGYAGWGPGQLDQEMQQNGWLHAPADSSILFDPELDGKWEKALAKLGINLSMLSADIGHA
ncbi:YqgE/AlgH family protein [Niveispirillum sp. KHB5.9]|uniref:YqgE/AlgH family protein n=1 Tax=Niveispirillum sp. KHB5.9 TaxID=3400269 RepID=UPI003A894559